MIKKQTKRPIKKTTKQPVIKTDLITDLRSMIEKTKSSIASAVNFGLKLLYWHIGNRIQSEILMKKRAEYGKSIITSLSQQLTLEYGNGFNSTNLHRMVKFSEVFVDKQIVASLTQQLSWTHFVILLPVQRLSIFLCK